MSQYAVARDNGPFTDWVERLQTFRAEVHLVSEGPVKGEIVRVDAFGLLFEELVREDKHDGPEWDHLYTLIPWSAIARIVWAEHSYGERWPDGIPPR